MRVNYRGKEFFVSGLAGFVAGNRPCSDPRDKLDYFRSVNWVPGVIMVEQNRVGLRCVLFNLFLKEGRSFLSQLKGEFAVALYQENPHRLHLFTDHLSTKSIFYLSITSGFSSDLKRKNCFFCAVLCLCVCDCARLDCIVQLA